MIYGLSAVLKNMDGTDSVADGKVATMHAALARALISDPAPIPSDKKLKRFALFTRIMAAETIELSVDEVALAKEAADVYPTLTYGQIVAFLDQRT